MKRKRSFSLNKRASKKPKTEAVDEMEEAFIKNELPKRRMEVKLEEASAKRLPIKTQSGRVKIPKLASLPKPPPKQLITDYQMEDKKQTGKKKGKKKKKRKKRKRKEKIPETPTQRFRRIKDDIGRKCTGILERPKDNLMLVKFVMEYSLEQNETEIEIRKLALISLCLVFVDLIPGYKINLERYENIGATNLSKEMKHQKAYETNLLKYYRDYLTLLFGYIDRRVRRNQRDEDVARKNNILYAVALECLTKLFLKGYNFNFSSNLIEKIVPLLNHKNDQTRMKVFNMFKEVFEKNKNHEKTLEIVEEIIKFTEQRQYNVKSCVVDVFLHLPLSIKFHDKHLRKPKKRAPSKSQKRKSRKDKNYVQKTIREGNAEIKISKIHQHQTDILRHVLHLYIKVIKFQAGELRSNVRLFSAGLVGLEKYAHLINIELVYDLLRYLVEILNNFRDKSKRESKLSINTIIQGINTAIALSFGYGRALDIDLNEFYTMLYELLAKAFMQKVNNVSIATEKLIVRSVYLLLIKTKNLNDKRVAAFSKRLMTLSLSTNVSMTLVFLNIVNSLLINYPNVQQLLRKEEVGGLGKYDEMSNNPDVVNPFATTLWEFNVLLTHYHPHVRILTKKMLDNFVVVQGGEGSGSGDKFLLREMNLDEYLEIYEMYRKKSLFDEVKKPKRTVEKRYNKYGTERLVFFTPSEYTLNFEEKASKWKK